MMLVNRINKINCVIFDRTQNKIIKLVINKYYSIEYKIILIYISIKIYSKIHFIVFIHINNTQINEEINITYFI
uniref:Uncharacterized protein n=1 Tax=viral metagenome TaxID=1070528 RepID=A0A6C0DZD9_9ZZZZ